MKGYKAFLKGMICNPNGSVKQYAENTVFEEPEASLCENPLDVLDFYPLIDGNGDLFEVAEVEALDTTQGDGKKFCTNWIKHNPAWGQHARSYKYHNRLPKTAYTKTAAGNCSYPALISYPSSRIMHSGYRIKRRIQHRWF